MRGCPKCEHVAAARLFLLGTHDTVPGTLHVARSLSCHGSDTFGTISTSQKCAITLRNPPVIQPAREPVKAGSLTAAPSPAGAPRHHAAATQTTPIRLSDLPIEPERLKESHSPRDRLLGRAPNLRPGAGTSRPRYSPGSHPGAFSRVHCGVGVASCRCPQSRANRARRAPSPPVRNREQRFRGVPQNRSASLAASRAPCGRARPQQSLLSAPTSPSAPQNSGSPVIAPQARMPSAPSSPKCSIESLASTSRPEAAVNPAAHLETPATAMAWAKASAESTDAGRVQDRGVSTRPPLSCLSSFRVTGT